jgi:hypothetical protein
MYMRRKLVGLKSRNLSVSGVIRLPGAVDSEYTDGYLPSLGLIQ